MPKKYIQDGDEEPIKQKLKKGILLNNTGGYAQSINFEENVETIFNMLSEALKEHLLLSENFSKEDTEVLRNIFTAYKSWVDSKKEKKSKDTNVPPEEEKTFHIFLREEIQKKEIPG